VQGGGGGTFSGDYISAVNSEQGSMTGATATQSGSGSLSGGGFGTIRGPNGFVSAGGGGGGNIDGDLVVYGFNGGEGITSGQKKVEGFGGGSAQFSPLRNAPNASATTDTDTDTGTVNDTDTDTTTATDTATNNTDTSIGGGGGSIAAAQTTGSTNLTATGDGAYAAGNSTSDNSAYGVGYGQATLPNASAGGRVFSDASGQSGGAGTAGEAPISGVVQGMGGSSQFNGTGGGESGAVAGGYIGTDLKEPDPYFPTSTASSNTVGSNIPNFGGSNIRGANSNIVLGNRDRTRGSRNSSP
jgi:hypothetical protein